MDIVAFYEKKPNKISTENFMEIDNQYLESYGDYEEHKEFSQISSKSIGGKTLQEWFEYDGISYWWFVFPSIYPKFNDGVLFVERFQSFLEKNKIKKIKLFGNYHRLYLIKEICKNNNIQLELSKNYFLFKTRVFFKKLYRPIAFKKITEKKTKKRLECYKNHTKKLLVKEKSVIVTSPGIYRRYMSDYKSGKTKKQEFVLQPTLDLLHKNQIPTICFDLDYTFRGETESLEERLKDHHVWMPIEILLKTPKSDRTKKILESLRQSFYKLKEQNLEKIFQYHDVSLWDFIKPKFEEVFLEPYLPMYVHLLEQIEEFLKNNSPTSVIQIYETGPYAKCFQLPAQKLGIKTVGLQHGIIYDGNPDYNQQIIKNEENPLGNQLPDLTLVYGKYYQRILTEKCNYPISSVETMGNPSFYNIDKLKPELSKEQILKKYYLENKKIILFPLSFRYSQKSSNNSDDIILDTLIKNMKHLNDVVIIVRPHPGDYDAIYSKLNQYNALHNFLVSKGSLFEDIVASDLIITTISSVGIDATIFEKPIFLIDIAGMTYDSLGGIHRDMTESDVAKIVSIKNLINMIMTIEKNQVWKTSDSEKRKKFVSDYFNYDKEVNLLNLIYNEKKL